MEAGESGARQSGLPPASNLNHFDQRHRERLDKPYNREGPAMATATLMSASAPYHPHPHHSYSSYPHSAPGPAPATSIPGMISPVEARRTSDDPDTPHRQSLPSISEVISGAKPGTYPPLPQTSLPPTQSLPSPFASSTPTRGFGDAGMEKNPSPRTLHPTSSGFSRPETSLPAFSDPARPSLQNRPAPPLLNTFPGQQPPPPVKMETAEAEQRHGDGPQMGPGYHHPPPSQPPSGLYSQTGRLPPGQLPLGYPVSPRHNGPSLPSPFESQRPPVYGDDGGFGHDRSNEHKWGVENRNFESWSYADYMSLIAQAGRTVFHFAEAYGAAAREQQGQTIPSRLPTENEVGVVIDNAMLAVEKLRDVRDMINRINTDRLRENGGRKGLDDDDTVMYGDGMKQAYSITEVKKRRGRAAPPGRCHSCNRIDTPEWRRGPDGARTLCNACGLHYAKLERKRQLEQRSIRPKPSDDRN